MIAVTVKAALTRLCSVAPPFQTEASASVWYTGFPVFSAWVLFSDLAGDGCKKEAAAFLQLLICVGAVLSSRAVASQVLSPLMSLTSVFGMGTGGPSSLLVPTSSSRTSQAALHAVTVRAA